ncbi:MAG: hypothetical protein P8179_22790 [Candidatus Thiodiazotropha sp.]|jgi:hypothetical protein
MTHKWLNFFGYILLIGLAYFSLSCRSSSDLFISTDKISSEEWSAEGVSFEMIPSGNSFLMKVSVSRFSHKLLSGDIRGIEYTCSEIHLDQRAYHCIHGSMKIIESPYGPQTFNADFNYVDPDNFSLKASGLKWAKGSLEFNLHMDEGVWVMKLQTKNIGLEPLLRQLPIQTLLREWKVFGITSIQAEFSGVASRVERVKMVLEVEQLNYSDQEGLQVAEGGKLRSTINAKQNSDEWLGSVDIDILKGQFYSDPHYIEITQSPLQIQLEGRWSPNTDRLSIRQASLRLAPAIQAQGTAMINLSDFNLISAVVTLKTEQLGAFYETLLQPILIGSILDELEASGKLQVEVAITKGIIDSFHAAMEQVSLDHKGGIFALHDLSGTLAWSKRGVATPSRIMLNDGQLYQIAFGPLSINLQSQNSDITLIDPFEIPLLGGKVKIEHFATQNLLSDTPVWMTGAEVSGLSVGRVATAFGWPDMQGELNGKLPAMRYRDHALQLDGALEVDLFGGDIRVDQLVIKQPLGRVPELFADAELHDLDLDQITRTFSFGHIEGGLDGAINNLHLQNWEPIAFQAHFHTPKRDHLAHRISQRAVDNLTSLGNGMSGKLSSTFLGIFKEFRYNRIELRAKLEGNLAELDGIEHPGGGYYLVKGAGLPRIDVIARNRRVAWKTLMGRLKNIRVEGMELR